MQNLTDTARYTEWSNGHGCGKPGKDCYTQLAKYEDSGLTPEQVAELSLAKKEGRLMILPCKTVWFIVDKGTEFAMVMQKPIEYLDLHEISKIDKAGRHYSTKEAAEQALQTMNGE